MEWLLFAGLFLGIWTAAITGSIESSLIKEWRGFILPLPAILLLVFGIYAAATVLYRVFTFNDCEGAAKELQRQIEEAKAELRIKGVL